MVRKLLATTAILFNLGLGSAAMAGTTVSYADLNLATPTGAATLEARVKAAAAVTCAAADKHLVAPAFASAASAACIKQISGIVLSSIPVPTQVALN